MKNFLLHFFRFLMRCLFAVCFPGLAARCPSVVPSLGTPRRRERDDDAAQPTLHLRLRQLLEETHEFRYNVLAEVPEFRERDGQGPFRRITPLDFNTLSIRAIDAGIGVWQRDVVRLLHSSLLPSFHPLTDYMNRLPDWDGSTGCARWASAYRPRSRGCAVSPFGCALWPRSGWGNPPRRPMTWCRCS